MIRILPLLRQPCILIAKMPRGISLNGRSPMRKMLALSMLLAPTSALHAATIIYTNESDFLSYIASGYYLEEFDGLLNPLPHSRTFGPVNGHGYTVSTNSGLYANPSALTTFSPQDAMLFTFSGTPATAVGGIFAATDDAGAVIAQNVTIESNDGTSSIVNPSGFVGFISDTPITWVSVTGAGTGGTYFPQADHFYVGASVPEPAMLLGSAIGAYCLLRRTRL
jgi:hypothetical protein